MTNLYKRFLGVGLVVFIFATVVISLNTSLSHAQAPSPSPTPDTTLFGWGWANNIGWVSINSSNGRGGPHSVVIDSAGNLKGWAWSSNIGWIKFGGLSGFPPSGSTAGNAKVSGAIVTGWARACSGTIKAGDPYLALNNYPTSVPTLIGDCSTMISRPDGWDGWIELTGANHTTKYNLFQNGTFTIDGTAWGSVNVGWLGFNITGTAGSKVPPPIVGGAGSCSLSSTPPPQGSATYTLSWSVKPSGSMSSCKGTNFDTGGAVFGSKDVNPDVDTTVTYSLSCIPITGGSAAISCQSDQKLPGIQPPVGAAAIPMWLDDDSTEKKVIKIIRIGQSAKINWRKNDSTTYSVCTAKVDGVAISGGGFDTTQHPNGSPYILSKDLLPAGRHSFSMKCTPSPYTGTDVSGIASNGSDKLTIKVIDPTITEK